MLKIPKPAFPQADIHRIDFSQAAARDFPTWHFAMLNDDARNRTIERCINDLPIKGKTVVEIGTGTGLIALMFARAGAERVVTCEMNPNLAEVARQVIGATPFADRITVVSCSSTEAIARGLVPLSPDYLFTETLDCGVVGESYFEVAQDVRRIVGPNTTILPGAVRQIGMVIESQEIANLNSVGDVCGFDLSMLNAFSTKTYYPVRDELHYHKELSAASLLREYDYVSDSPASSVTVDILSNGTGCGILSWMEIDFGAYQFTNAPGISSHWHKAFHPFESPIKVSAGQRFDVSINDKGTVGFNLASRSAFPGSGPRSAEAQLVTS